MSTAIAASRYLDLHALAAVAHMRFTTRHRLEGALSGRHTSRQQGGAGEFADYREYTAGEDLRRFDWKVFARSGRAYVRLYQDETNLACTLLIDGSGSMLFGGDLDTGPGSKLEYAQRLATALSYVIVQGQDRVGLAVADGQLREWIAPGGTNSHLARVHEAIERVQTQRATHMAEAVRELFERSGRRGVLLAISDFLMEDVEDTFARLRWFRQRQWETIALHLVHPQEERLPEGVAYRFEGLEREGSLACSPAELAAEYERRFAAHLALVRSLALAAGCDYRLVSTAVGYMQTLRGFLVERSG
jgi:uncharacterized protein (DUF58 family)